MTDWQRAVFAAAFVAELRNGESRYSAAAAGIDAVIELNLAAGAMLPTAAGYAMLQDMVSGGGEERRAPASGVKP